VSIGLVAFLFGVAAFLAVYAATAPVHDMPDEEVEILRGLNPESGRSAAPEGLLGKYVLPVVRNFMPQTPMAATVRARQSDKITELLVRSGNPWNIQPEEYVGIRILAGVGGALAGLVLALMKMAPFSPPMAMGLGLLLGAYIPKVLLDGAKGKRKKEASKGLPEALDLLRITMNSGQPFAPALAEVARRMPEGLIKVELSRVADEMRSGRTTESALRDFARRSPTDEVESFCKAVIQSEKLGANVTDTLASQAKSAREAFEAQLDVKIGRLPTTLFFPILGLMLPALFIVLLAPAISNIGKAF
jgi:tight adherence protein C